MTTSSNDSLPRGELSAGQCWPKTDKELAEMLGISATTIRRHVQINRKDLIKGVHYNLHYHESNSRDMYLWLEEGAIFLAKKCRQRKAKDFLETVGAASREKSHVESDTISIIIHALEGFLTVFKKQHYVDGFRVDLYLPEIKVVVECDERGHSHHSQWEEEYREAAISEKLGCTFVRYNPDEPGFNIGRVINTLFKMVLEIRQTI